MLSNEGGLSPVPHRFIHHIAIPKRYEAESSGLSRLSIFHHDAVRQISPLRVEISKTLIRSLVIEAADKQFPKLFRLASIVLGFVLAHCVGWVFDTHSISYCLRGCKRVNVN